MKTLWRIGYTQSGWWSVGDHLEHNRTMWKYLGHGFFWNTKKCL